MTRVLRMLAGAGVAALLLGSAGLMSASTVSAESPPAPPSRITGSVMVDGATVPAGTVIQARIGSASCGVASTDSASRYLVDVPALDPGANPNCGAEGAIVSFWIGDKLARETATWKNWDVTVLNLTYVTPPTVTPGAGITPGTGGTVTTPRPPASGTLGPVEGGNDAMLWVLVALGAGALAFGVSGAAVARRSR